MDSTLAGVFSCLDKLAKFFTYDTPNYGGANPLDGYLHSFDQHLFCLVIHSST